MSQNDCVFLSRCVKMFVGEEERCEMWEQTVSRDNLSGELKVIALLESPTFGSSGLPFAASLAYAFADNSSERVA
ncbi:hypothetical protein TNCV_289731 [Trichonephila clavipes]|nr:hypothetical protein TNCV_289731 [Trichonephila clavipes]